MRVVAVEEHFVTLDVLDAWRALPGGSAETLAEHSRGRVGEQLLELGEERLREMDADGIATQVLSLTSPGRQNIRTKGVMLNRRTGERNIDDPCFDSVYATAAHLRVPIYLHPQAPGERMRTAYYSGLSPSLDTALATWGLGWHYETGVELLRLIPAGVLDRHPKLQLIVGHWGEVVPFFIERMALIDHVGSGLKRPLADYLRENVSYTPSGMLSQRYLRWTIDLDGIDRVLFAMAYPYMPVPPGAVWRFFEEFGLTSAEQTQWRAATGSG